MLYYSLRLSVDALTHQRFDALTRRRMIFIFFGFGLMTLRLVQVYYRWIMLGEPILEERKEGENLEMETPHV